MTLRYPVTPTERTAALAAKLGSSGFARVIEVHNGLSALVAQTSRAQRDAGTFEFDALWISSLTDSASRGLPDAEIVGNGERLDLVREVCAVTTKPVIVDGDTGGTASQFEYFVRGLILAGASAVVIEDKRVPKRNSLDHSAHQELEDPPVFAQKIARGKAAAAGSGFMVIARLESLISGSTVDDALYRARRCAEAGADGILIHSKQRTPDEVFAFAARYDEAVRGVGRRPFLVCVPTTYNLALDSELARRGFNVVIHANHLLRAAHHAMTRAAQSILENDRSFEATAVCSPVSEIFAAVGYDELTQKDRELSGPALPVIISAEAPDGIASGDLPRALVPVGDRPLLRHQVESARKAGFARIGVITGHGGAKVKSAFQGDGLRFFDSERWESEHLASTIFSADPMMEGGYLLLYGDVLVAPEVLRQVLETPGAIVVAVDRPQDHHAGRAHEEVIVGARAKGRRRLRPSDAYPVLRIGRAEQPSHDGFEFSGIVHVSREGAQILRKLYQDARERHVGPFHGARSAADASFTELLQECIERGFEVRAVEIVHGWMSIRTVEDVAFAAGQLDHPSAPAPLRTVSGSAG